MKIINKLQNNIKLNWAKLLVFLFISIIMTIALVFIYIDTVRPAMNARTRYISTTIQTPEIMMKDKVTVRQKIVMVSDSVEGFSLAFDTFENTSDMDVDISFVEPQQNKVLHTWNLKMSEAIDGGYSSIYFESPYNVQKGKVYELVITPHSNGGQDAKLYIADENIPHTYAYVGDKKTANSLSYEILGPVGAVSKYVFLVVSLGLYVLLGMSYYAISNRCKIERKFAVIALFLGILYLFLIPPYAAPDEEIHIITVYEKSSILLGEKTVDAEKYVIARGEEFNYYRRTKIPKKETYNQYLKGMLNVSDSSISDEVVLYPSGSMTGVEYMPQILGVTLARVVGLNGEQLLMLGRLFGLLFYIAIVYLAIKLMPFAKRMIVVVALLSMCLQQAASFSYDVTLNSLAFLLIAYFIHLIYEKKSIQKKDVFWLTIITIILSPIKVVYIMIIGLGVLIPYEKFGSKIRKWVTAVILFASGIVSILVLRSVGVAAVVSGGGLTWTTEKGYTLASVLNNPVKLFGVFFRTFEYMTTDYIETGIGARLGWLTIQIPNIIIIGFVLLIFVSILKEEKEPLFVKPKEKAWMLLISFICILGICISMLFAWTRENSLVIEGVQGRYFIPILPLLLLVSRNNVIVLKKNIDSILLLAMVTLQIGTLLSIFQTVMSS